MAGTLAAVLLLWLPAAGFCQGKAYKIGPRDILKITIHAGGEVQSTTDVTVSAKGSINVPFIGEIKAEGLTIDRLEAKITAPLSRDYFVNPKVNVNIKEYHSLHYYISGAVGQPGLYETSSEITLMELIAKAGGVLPDRGNWAYVMRGDEGEGPSEQRKIDLKRLLVEGDMSRNLPLEPGDVVYIPAKQLADQAESKIYVEGEVKNPALYDYQPGMTAMSACIMAGGFDRFAAPNRTRIIRKNGDEIVVIKINLEKVKEGEIPDVKLQPGDRIHVPETWL